VRERAVTNFYYDSIYNTIQHEPENRPHMLDRLYLCNAFTLYGHIKTADQRTIIQQYGDWYTGRCRVAVAFIWYSEGLGSPVPSWLYQM